MARAELLIFVVLLGQEDDLGFRADLPDFPGCIESVEEWHSDIEQHSVWEQLGCFLDGFHAVTSFADDLKVWSGAENPARDNTPRL